MAILGFEFEEISRMLALMESSGLEEIIWEEENRYLRVRGARAAMPTQGPAQMAAPPAAVSSRPTAAPRAISSKGPEPLPENQVALVAPMVGVFYRAGKPGDPPFVEVGQHVSRDQTIGVIEAMKIFSEIPAEHSGVVVAVPAQDGQLVQAGTPLIVLRTED